MSDFERAELITRCGANPRIAARSSSSSGAWSATAAEPDLERARRAAFVVLGLAREPVAALREVREAAALEALQERRLDEAVHQLDRRGIGHRDEHADIGLEEQLERRRGQARAEIDDDPVRGQLAELIADQPHQRRARARRSTADRRRRRSASRRGTWVGDGELGERRPVRGEGLRQRARGPRHAGEDVEVGRAERRRRPGSPACRAWPGRCRRSRRPGSCPRRPCRHRWRPREESWAAHNRDPAPTVKPRVGRENSQGARSRLAWRRRRTPRLMAGCR